MTEKQAYSYTILRYVHDVVSGEALNVGVVMHVRSGDYFEVRTRKTVWRLRHVFPDLDRQAFVSAMKAVDRGFADVARRTKGQRLLHGEVDARSLALKLLPDDDSALQWSPAGTGLTTDPAKTFERLYERYVAHYDSRVERRRTDEDVWRPIFEALTEREVFVPFEPKTVTGTQDRIAFKNAWKNGRWHAYEPVSFDLADADRIKDKARRWRGHLAAVWEGKSEDIDLHFFLGLPRNAALIPAYKAAKRILEGARFTAEVLDESDADDLVTALEGEFRAHRSEPTR